MNSVVTHQYWSQVYRVHNAMAAIIMRFSFETAGMSSRAMQFQRSNAAKIRLTGLETEFSVSP
jgi:hypothetical protein